MIDLNPSPSRQLRTLARIARWSLGLVVAFWLVLIGVWGALHGFIVPRIGEWRSEVQQLASQAVGAPVTIASITARSEGLFPTVILEDLQVLDAQGTPALQLSKVVATVSARSVLRWGLEQLYIDAPHLDIRHLPDGRWQVAGLDVVESQDGDGQALEWLLEQPELVVRNGSVTFTDEQAGASTLQWNDVDILVRHRHWNHAFRIDATPDRDTGERMQVVGAFRQPLLPSRKAPWTRWSGQWFADLSLQEIPRLPWPQAWGIAAIEGHGAARLWVDVEAGRVAGVAADMALPQARVQWRDAATEPLQMTHLRGRLQADWQAQAWRMRGSDFQFVYAEGIRWPQSQWEVRSLGDHSAPHTTQITLSEGDLAVASQVAHALPLPGPLQAALRQWQPQGVVQGLKLQWSNVDRYQASGRVSGLQWQSQAAAVHADDAQAHAGIPGAQGVDVEFALDQTGGKARLAMRSGALDFPGVFEEPVIPLEALDAQVRWSVQNKGLSVNVEHATFANADAQGQFTAAWKTGATAATRWPGELQLKGVLEQADGARVHRYLPLVIPAIARHYVRDSVRQGDAQQVQFEVSGPLVAMPFAEPGSGRFFIHAPVRNVVYDYVPTQYAPRSAWHWPGLQNLSGTLEFEGVGMSVLGAQTSFVGHERLHLSEVQAHIPQLDAPALTVKVAGQSDLQAMLALARRSPLSPITDHALDEAQAQGPAKLAFTLELPIDHLDRSKVTGNVQFLGNQLQFMPSAPVLHNLQGAVQFTEHGFALQRVEALSMGGAVQLRGGMSSLKEGVQIQAAGVATEKGLAQQEAIPVVAALAQHAQGQAAYHVDIRAQQGVQTIDVHSDLQGMALNLPAPLNKLAAHALPLHVQRSVTAGQHQALQIDAGDWLRVAYREDLSTVPARVIAGRIAIGAGVSQDVPAHGVTAQVRLPSLDVDAWQPLLTDGPSSAASSDISGYFPHAVQLDIQHLRLRERELQTVQAHAQHHKDRWDGTFTAQQFAGAATYFLPNVQMPSGKLVARLRHLHIPQAEAQRLNQVTGQEQHPENLPALDVQVEQLEIGNKELGQLHLQARNRTGPYGREWLLEKFALQTPEARWLAEGVWGKTSKSGLRQTELSFSLAMDSSGKLLERFGMPDVIRDGQGQLQGHVAWQGSPISPHWASMQGAVQMNVDKGQFLQVEPGLGKLLSVLSLQSLTRRITLDFRDVFSQGFAFDFIRGDVRIDQGVARTNNLQMKGLNAAVLMEGQASLLHETQDIQVVVVPEINAMTASLAATAINPVVGLGSFLAQMFLRGPLMEAATRTFHVHGSWSDPIVDPVTTNRSGGEGPRASTPRSGAMQ